jgi:hypothetical protein
LLQHFGALLCCLLVERICIAVSAFYLRSAW